MRIRNDELRAKLEEGNSTVVGYIHRYVLNVKSNKQVDHKFHNKLDNRKSELRLCTRSQNNMNKKSKGIYYDPNTNKWCAEIHVNKNKIWLGRHSTEAIAKSIRRKAELKYFGNYAYAE